MYTVSIDIGSTFTHGIFIHRGEIIEVKVDATPHDIAGCLFECLNQGASKLGFESLDKFMGEISIIRWCSSIAANILAEKTGPKLGLIVEKGYSTNLYGSDENQAIGTIIHAGDILEISETPTEEDALILVKQLLEKGVRKIVISLKGAYKDRSTEEKVKQWIEDQYPDHYLGSVPVVVGSDSCRHSNDETRTNYSLIDAYLHEPLAASLFNIEDQLVHDYEFRGDLLVGLNNGGSCRVGKVKPMDTVESGSIMGIFGSAHFAEKYELKKVCTVDIGGTTTKLGVIHDYGPVRLERTELFGLPLDIQSILLRSLFLGGNTVVKVDRKLSGLKIGPESTGGYPGPACYDLGGTEPTVTDALLLLGLIGDNKFLEGERILSSERAAEAIHATITRPLKLGDAREAARLIVDSMLDLLCQELVHTLPNIHQQPVSEYVLFAFGGNGAPVACMLAEKLGIKIVKVFRFGSVFSALGSSMGDVIHVYEEFLENKLSEVRPKEFRNIVASMMHSAEIDLKGECFDSRKAIYTLDVDILDAAIFKTVTVSVGYEDSDLEKAWKRIVQEHGRARVKTIRLKSIFEISKYEPVVSPYQDVSVPYGSKTSSRFAFFHEVPVFLYSNLRNGNRISGPAVVEGGYTTCYIPEGWFWETDEYLNGTVKRVGG